MSIIGAMEAADLIGMEMVKDLGRTWKPKAKTAI
jgi:hypothetical protein